MMYYNCDRCNRPIKKPYPSKKYCSVACRDISQKLRIEEQELQFWNSIKPLAVTEEEQQVLNQMDPAPRAGLVIERMTPAGAVGYRVGCRRIGSEAYTVHWFPTARQRPSSLFKLNPIELPLHIPCPAEYVVVYFDAGGRPFASPCYKLFLRSRVISVNWSDGDRRLLIGRSTS